MASDWGNHMNSYIRKSILLILDIVLINIAYFGAFTLRFEGHIGYFIELFNDTFVLIVVIYVINNWLFGLYKKMWQIGRAHV